jgi:pimeloyl-ACP methyl ester carboxylesterase
VSYLRRAGLQVEAPDFRGMKLAERVDTLEPILARSDAPLVIGSSYGGLAALLATIRHRQAGGVVSGLILCAPALGVREPPATRMTLRAPVPTAILHGTRDEVVPIAGSRDLARRDPNVKLIELDDDHRLAASLDALLGAVIGFVESGPPPAPAG